MSSPVLVVGTSANLTPDDAARIRAALEEMVTCRVVIITQCTALAVIQVPDGE